ncbi:MAG: tRNA (N6-isopentenyl adenosine(37)-C2)-methylthiotransferase MiaB [Robiginitomaculum sp.]|nr:MAG: tRNA (N6-isopentenyl adenosine(37)-C2)-methylthiotransferase MiaB [Robiginitomaculum sp.]
MGQHTLLDGAKDRTVTGETVADAKPKTIKNTKKLFIKTYGCQMNVYDTERMREVLAPVGYEPIDGPEGADMVVLNTCHIREKAAEKVYSELGRIRKLKEKKAKMGDGKMIVAVAGCVAQAEGEEIMRRAPIVDLVLGPQTYHKLPEMIAKISRSRGERLETSFDTQEKFDALPVARKPDGYTAFLTIQEGCDKFCTFCVVPYTRGAEFSRPVDQIVAEARSLVSQGVKEITLIGQNVNAYLGKAPKVEGDGEWGLGQLIRHLATMGGLERLRFTTSHPRDMDDELIAVIAEEPKLMPYLHLPLQAGSDRILRAMNRGHTFAHYRDVIARIRKARPEIALSSDFIVGFPGESELDFQCTLDAVREIGYGAAYSFKYSVRPGTSGAALPGQIDEDVKSERLARLQALLQEQQKAFNQSLIGRTLDILVEGTSRGQDGLFGRAPYLQGTHFKGDESLVGTIVKVKIEDAGLNSLSGTLVDG